MQPLQLRTPENSAYLVHDARHDCSRSASAALGVCVLISGPRHATGCWVVACDANFVSTLAKTAHVCTCPGVICSVFNVTCSVFSCPLLSHGNTNRQALLTAYCIEDDIKQLTVTKCRTSCLDISDVNDVNNVVHLHTAMVQKSGGQTLHNFLKCKLQMHSGAPAYYGY